MCCLGLAEAEVVGEKCVAVSLCPSQFAHGLCWDHRWGCAVHGQTWHSLLGVGTERSAVGKLAVVLNKEENLFTVCITRRVIICVCVCVGGEGSWVNFDIIIIIIIIIIRYGCVLS